MTGTGSDLRNAPIGLFDSGLGGLTVVRQIQKLLPNERIVFVADQAHVPYGGRDLKEVCGFACGITEALIRHGCKAVVMACNISSATGLRHAQVSHADVPISGVIEPGAKAAAHSTKTRRIGVLATEGTVRSGAYTRTLQHLNPELMVLELACPEFVPLVEAGQEQSLESDVACRAALAPMTAASVDVIILGCTHYPFLLPMLQKHRPDVLYVDPAEQTVHDLAATLTARNLMAPSNTLIPAFAHLLTTGDVGAFSQQIARFLPTSANAITSAAAWQHGFLHLSAP